MQIFNAYDIFTIFHDWIERGTVLNQSLETCSKQVLFHNELAFLSAQVLICFCIGLNSFKRTPFSRVTFPILEDFFDGCTFEKVVDFIFWLFLVPTPHPPPPTPSTKGWGSRMADLRKEFWGENHEGLNSAILVFD